MVLWCGCRMGEVGGGKVKIDTILWTIYRSNRLSDSNRKRYKFFFWKIVVCHIMPQGQGTYFSILIWAHTGKRSAVISVVLSIFGAYYIRLSTWEIKSSDFCFEKEEILLIYAKYFMVEKYFFTLIMHFSFRYTQLDYKRLVYFFYEASNNAEAQKII